jgi:hypothetical protein
LHGVLSILLLLLTQEQKLRLVQQAHTLQQPPAAQENNTAQRQPDPHAVQITAATAVSASDLVLLTA